VGGLAVEHDVIDEEVELAAPAQRRLTLREAGEIAIANSRLISFDRAGVTFKWKDYRAKGRDRQKIMTLSADEFIRRFLLHVLPPGFHRIRHYGLFANGSRAENLARARELLAVAGRHQEPEPGQERDDPPAISYPCPSCGGPMIIIETFEPGRLGFRMPSQMCYRLRQVRGGIRGISVDSPEGAEARAKHSVIVPIDIYIEIENGT
jgi:hypothetical protein